MPHWGTRQTIGALTRDCLKWKGTATTNERFRRLGPRDDGEVLAGALLFPLAK